ncbi:uncharacterized protein [Watersipora subatra]|uniref:uncharacterized protein n=1 Tax=Watersipora subatra TaxID=2589382 RepID=UPI00355C2D19
MLRHFKTGVMACLAAVLLTSCIALPVSVIQGNLDDQGDHRSIQERSLGSSQESVDTLQVKKMILEKMLEETRDEIKNTNSQDIVKKSQKHELAARFIDHGPSADRPTKKSNSDEENFATESDEVEMLSQLLSVLENDRPMKTTSKPAADSSVLPAADSQHDGVSFSKLYHELAKLDIDIQALLDTGDK